MYRAGIFITHMIFRSLNFVGFKCFCEYLNGNFGAYIMQCTQLIIFMGMFSNYFFL